MNEQRGPSTTPAAEDSAAATPVGRRYSGQASCDRIKDRRGRLIEAAIEVFGTTGYASAKVKEICRVAGLSERYFYESFANREELLYCVYADLTERIFEITRRTLVDAGDDIVTGARGGLAAFVGFLLGDRRYARIVLVEVVGVSEQLERQRFAALNAFAEIVRHQVLTQPVPERDSLEPDTGDHADRVRIAAVALVGAVNHVLVDWLMSGHEITADLIVDVCFQLFENTRTSLPPT
jgi:AcrR family transcriptional regulator